MGNLIDIGSPVQDAVVQSSVVQNLKGCFLLGGLSSYSSELGYARNNLWIHPESHRLGVRPESRPLGLRIFGFVRF
jgi:hypothetical protein